MKFIFYLFAYLLYSSISLAEKVPAGYVAKWDTSHLTELDNKIKNENSCLYNCAWWVETSPGKEYPSSRREAFDDVEH